MLRLDEPDHELLRMIKDIYFKPVGSVGFTCDALGNSVKMLLSNKTLCAAGVESHREALLTNVTTRIFPGLRAEFDQLSRVELGRLSKVLQRWCSILQDSCGELDKDTIGWPREPLKLVDPADARLLLRVRHGESVLGAACVPWAAHRRDADGSTCGAKEALEH